MLTSDILGRTLGYGSRGRSFILLMIIVLVVPASICADAQTAPSSVIEQGIIEMAVDGTSTGIQWKVSDLFYGDPILASDGTTYILMSEVDAYGVKRPMGLRALDEGGVKKWEVPIDGLSTDPVVDAHGNVYLTFHSTYTYDSELISFDSTGSIRWRYNLSQASLPLEMVLGKPIPHPDGQVLVPVYNRFDPADENSLMSLSQDGTVQWIYITTVTMNNVYVGPSVNSYVYITSSLGMVQGIFPNGSLAWTLDLRDDRAFIGSPSMVGYDENLYMPVSRYDNGTQWRNASVPQEIWSVARNGSVVITTSLFSEFDKIFNSNIVLTSIVANGSIYCISTKGFGGDPNGSIDLNNVLTPSRALALTPQGDVLWSYSLNTNDTFYSPAIMTQSSMYLFPLDHEGLGEIVAIDPGNGSVMGKYLAPNKLWLSGKVVGTGDRFLYFEGTYKGAEEGMITLVSTDGLPRLPVERPLELMVASVAWISIIGLMVGGGIYVTRKKKA